MRERWSKCRDTIGSDSELRARWDSLTDKGKARYKGDNNSERYRKFVNAETFKEVETRDWRWLYTGEVPRVDYSDNPKSSYGTLLKPEDYSPDNIVDKGNEWRDLWAHHVLSESGFSVKTFDSSHLDLTIDGVWWDVKSPESSGEGPRPGRELSFIENDVRKAIRQFKKRGIPRDEVRIVYNPRYRHVASDEEMTAELVRQMRGHGVKEALFITESGEVVRLRT